MDATEANQMKRSSIRKQRADYVIDGALTALVGLVLTGVSGLVLASFAFLRARSHRFLLSIFELLGGLLLLQVVPSYLYSTRRRKFEVWAELLGQLALRGAEQVLDIGCGRGAVLVIAAKLIPHGRAVGLDLWRPEDQSGNSPEAAWRNLGLEGVRERCEFVTADMTAMPFPDTASDVVVSSLAIHNIKERHGNIRAIDEAVRV
jgi:arsenite methyltransferase